MEFHQQTVIDSVLHYDPNIFKKMRNTCTRLNIIENIRMKREILYFSINVSSNTLRCFLLNCRPNKVKTILDPVEKKAKDKKK